MKCVGFASFMPADADDAGGTLTSRVLAAFERHGVPDSQGNLKWALLCNIFQAVNPASFTDEALSCFFRHVMPKDTVAEPSTLVPVEKLIDFICRDADDGTGGCMERADAGSDVDDDETSSPGPLAEGAFVWKPVAPIQIFSCGFGDVVGEGCLQEVTELTLTEFLGSGAEGTVYRGAFAGPDGCEVPCALKFCQIFEEPDPGTHEALRLLTREEGKAQPQGYLREKRAMEMLRPKDSVQYQEFAGSRIRLVQFLGFHDQTAALVLELCEGTSPALDDDLSARIEAFLDRVEGELQIQVGDRKGDNLIQSADGVVHLIDFGICQYVGGAFCLLCKEQVGEDVDAHAAGHMAEFMSQQKKRIPVSRLRLQHFCYGTCFC